MGKDGDFGYFAVIGSFISPYFTLFQVTAPSGAERPSRIILQ